MSDIEEGGAVASQPTDNQTPTQPVQTESWNSGFSEDLKGNQSLDKFKSSEDLAKSYLELEKSYSSKSKGIDMPSDWENKESVDKFYSNFRPESKDKYDFGSLTDEEKGAYQDAFYDNGLSERQANNILKTHNDNMTKQTEALMSKDGYDNMIKDTFNGDENSMKGVQAHLRETLSETDQAVLEKLPNEIVGLVYRSTKTNLEKFGASEGGAINNTSSSQNLSKEQTAASRKAIRAELTALTGKPHRAEHKAELMAKLTKTYGA